MVQPGKRRFVRAYRYYEILEVSINATQNEIRRAFRKLAKIWHPDVNKDPEAPEKFKKINDAYEILSDPQKRSIYDNSPAECPDCWTHEVIQTTEIYWRCRHCGCKFNPSRASEIIEQVEKAAIPERLRNMVRIFQTTQCSWCRKFYTQPFLCPSRRLQSSCISYDRLGNEERGQLLGNEKWWWRMADMIQQVKERGIMGKCRECGALNPNPQKFFCWHCGKNTLCCPRCPEAPILRYDIERDFWKCPNAGCGRKFAIRPKPRVVEPTLSQEICPNCGANLYYDAGLLMWRCRNCRHIYTKQDLERERAYRKAKPRKTGQAEPRAEYSYRPPKEPPPPDNYTNRYRSHEQPRRKKRVPGSLIFLIVVFAISILASGIYGLYKASNPETTEYVDNTEHVDTTDTSDTEATSADTSNFGAGVSVFYNTQPPYSKALGSEDLICLVNNNDATDPTWQQLMAFLLADTTDQGQYLPGFHMCGHFAEQLHNNAEAAGITAAWVAVDFEAGSEGHALNAFNTVDRGIVFVDCTGLPPSTETEPSGFDKIAYVVVGEEYGLISLDVASSPEYSYYEAYSAKWEEYDCKLEEYIQEVDAYNQALGGRRYLDEPEYSYFMEWKERLDSMLAELETLSEEIGYSRWPNLGVVSEIEIYW